MPVMKEEDYLNQVPEEIKERYEELSEKIDYGEFEGVEEGLKELLEDYPDLIPVYNKLGVLAVHQGDKEKALDWFEEGLDKAPDFAPIITNIGSIEKEKGNIEKAKENYERAIRLDPDYGPAYNNLGVIQREEGNYSKAVKNLKKARKLGDYAVDRSTDKPVHKDPGCVIPILLIVVFIILTYFMFFN